MATTANTDELDKREALERVIYQNLIDLGRVRDAQNGADIAIMAESWLRKLTHVPNAYMEHDGQELHLLEVCYLTHILTADRPRPLTVIDLLGSWRRLQEKWAEEAIHARWDDNPERLKLREQGMRGVKIVPLDPAEARRRAEACQRERERLAWAHDAQTARTVQANRPTVERNGANSARLAPATGVNTPQTHLGAIEAQKRGDEPVAPEVTAVQAESVGAESVEECGLRLGCDVTFPDNPCLSAYFVRFNREWQEETGRPLEWEDINEHWEAFVLRLKSAPSKSSPAKQQPAGA